MELFAFISFSISFQFLAPNFLKKLLCFVNRSEISIEFPPCLIGTTYSTHLEFLKEKNSV